MVLCCSCVQIRNWFDYRNHICIVSHMDQEGYTSLLSIDGLEFNRELMTFSGI